MHEAWAVVPAAGRGQRMGAGRPKQFLDLGGVPVLTRTLAALEAVPDLTGVVLVTPPGQEDATLAACVEPFGLAKVQGAVAGGAERQDSVAAGTALVREAGVPYVVVHDGARPLAAPELFTRVLAAARRTGAALAAMPVADTVKQAGPGELVAGTLDRRGLWLAQTPQAFRTEILAAAQARARAAGFLATDEAGLASWAGHPVELVMGSPRNLKLTTPDDLDLARALLPPAPAAVPRVGQGFDAHRLAPGRRLVLAGVEIAHARGLLGHSDADVLAHAVMDALLAAAGLGDIGGHFPDSDPQWAGADSLELLTRVVGLLAVEGWRPAQVSVTLMAQRPKVAPHVPAMRANLARALGLAEGQINLAATTTEHLGFVGREEGMAASALAVILPLTPEA
ncbi:MAG: 2-C-methyl-D-erythritol 4-phosphate cytidylyltransferase [Deltaproteobacteria bacterium]|nr:2-C-methyl-D-erythritol 4-phosphate cytidylyltransferase [Deltaproteobacteria bacterium]MCB2186329.1 2-C-methyl-D-erythritol 4-phosphate cytidylyltransferase [Deltaproteobacteria bacterium]